MPYNYGSSAYTAITNKLQQQTIMRDKILKTIAKQEIGSIYLNFTIEPDNPQLVECMIHFPSKSSHKELYNALVKAYGKPKYSERANFSYIWLGKNNTILLLNNRFVIYATLDGLALAETFDLPGEEKEDTDF